MTLAERQQQNSRNAKISLVAGFTKSMPEKFDNDAQLEVDDVINIPNPIGQVYKQTFGTKSDGTEAYGEFIIVTVTNPRKPERAINFFPAQMLRNIWKAEKVGDVVDTITEGGPLHPLGTAVDAFRAYQGQGDASATDMQKAMNSIAGRAIRITGRTPIQTQVWRNGEPINQLRYTYQLTYDF